ncbi:MAG TPA: glucose-6-phosphate dehydrogenase assembly protein OpcA [Gaiellaceae bacterium]|nr:glucose-6-phosphate dehydrogenase assembly protein OpcA [Gaiellaceae bacterium]
MAPALNSAPLEDSWTGEDATIAQIERELARLRYESSLGSSQQNLRTSVMTHLAWAPPEWQTAAEETLAGMAERHPSRTLLLVPKPDEPDGLDAQVSVRCFPIGDRAICGEVIELTLRGNRVQAPASLVLPLLISDLPVFLRWRGEPPWDGGEFEQLIEIVDRLVVDSTEWDGLPGPYARLVELFDRVAVSDIAWARTERWRSLLASLWPGIAEVSKVRVHGTPAQAHLLAGWLRSRLHHDLEVEVDEQERLEGIDLDGEPAHFPPGRPPNASDVLSAQLDSFARDPVYEAAVRAAAATPGV